MRRPGDEEWCKRNYDDVGGSLAKDAISLRLAA